MILRTYFLTCSSGRCLKLTTPAIETTLPEVESVEELHTMPDAPRIEMEIVCDDGGEAYPTIEEMLEGIRFLEANELIPDGLADDLRSAIAGLLR